MDELYSTIVSELFPDIDCFVNENDYQSFLDVILDYVNKIRIDSDNFVKHMNGLKEFFLLLGYNYKDIINCIMAWPSIIHCDKNELFYKYLLLAKVKNVKTGESDRDNILINHPKDLMVSVQSIYSRICYLLSPEAQLISRSHLITRRKVLKTTWNEFKTTYKQSKETLEKLYPFSMELIPSILKWPENEELLKRIQKNNLSEADGWQP